VPRRRARPLDGAAAASDSESRALPAPCGRMPADSSLRADVPAATTSTCVDSEATRDGAAHRRAHEARRARFEMRHFGAILRYLDEALGSYAALLLGVGTGLGSAALRIR